MNMQDFLNGIIVGMIAIKIVEYKLKHSKNYQNFMKNNKFGRIVGILKEKKKDEDA